MAAKRRKTKAVEESASYFLSPEELEATRTRRLLGYGVIALGVAGALVLGFAPRVFGVPDAPVSVGFGVAALAGFRLMRLRTALKQHQQTQLSARR